MFQTIYEFCFSALRLMQVKHVLVSQFFYYQQIITGALFAVIGQLHLFSTAVAAAAPPKREN